MPFFGKITAKAIDRILLVPIIFLRPGLYNIDKAFREPIDYTFRRHRRQNPRLIFWQFQIAHRPMSNCIVNLLFQRIPLLLVFNTSCLNIRSGLYNLAPLNTTRTVLLSHYIV